uniref:Ig-like domain-containing protein n=1 Tax=Mola mola TaxID=94237 RepID=A0A3Q3X2D8_MOLML
QLFGVFRQLLNVCWFVRVLSDDVNRSKKNGIRLHVEALRASVSATRGSTVTLPCHYPATRETEVIVATGNRHRSYGSFRGRVHLRRSAPGDLSLVINELRLNDTGRYRCEVIDGLEDQSVTVELELQGRMFLLRPSVCEQNT